MTTVKTQKTDIVVVKDINPIVARFHGKEIASPKDMTDAAEALSKLNILLDTLTKEKELITKPINIALKEVRERYKPAQDQLEELIELIRAKMTAYQTRKVQEEKEEQEKIAARIGEGKGKLKVETAVRKIDEVEKTENKVATDSGMVKFKTVMKFEVVDLQALPVDYILANETLIRKQLIAGVTDIPGVRYYEEQVPVNYR